MSGNQEEVENIEDMEMYQLELLESCKRNRDELFSEFDRVVKMSDANTSKKTEMAKLDTSLLELKGNLEFFKNSSGLDVATKKELDTIYQSVNLKINGLEKQRYPGAESYFLPNTLNRGFSVKTPEPVLPKSQGSANSFNIFSPRPQAQAPRAKGFNSLSPLGEAQFAQAQGSANIFSPFAQAPKHQVPGVRKNYDASELKPGPNTVKQRGGSKKTQRKRMNNKRKSRKSRY